MMLFLARSEAIHCSRKRTPKIRLPDNPITFQVFISIMKKENVPNTDIFRYRIEFPPSQAERFEGWSACERNALAYLRTGCEFGSLGTRFGSVTG
jgi:hypothetical protein